jgi:hypothetical protein
MLTLKSLKFYDECFCTRPGVELNPSAVLQYREVQKKLTIHTLVDEY